MSDALPVMMHATDAAAWMAGAHLVGPDAAIRRVTTDSRDVLPGDLFVALIGERFDAHDFLPDVVARGPRRCWYRARRPVSPTCPAWRC